MKMVYADTQAKWLPRKEVLMLSYYVFEIDYGYCGNYSVAIWADRSIYCFVHNHNSSTNAFYVSGVFQIS